MSTYLTDIISLRNLVVRIKRISNFDKGKYSRNLVWVSINDWTILIFLEIKPMLFGKHPVFLIILQNYHMPFILGII